MQDPGSVVVMGIVGTFVMFGSIIYLGISNPAKPGKLEQRYAVAVVTSVAGAAMMIVGFGWPLVDFLLRLLTQGG